MATRIHPIGGPNTDTFGGDHGVGLDEDDRAIDDGEPDLGCGYGPEVCAPAEALDLDDVLVDRRLSFAHGHPDADGPETIWPARSPPPPAPATQARW
jgi:hypothetical protein